MRYIGVFAFTTTISLVICIGAKLSILMSIGLIIASYLFVTTCIDIYKCKIVLDSLYIKARKHLKEYKEEKEKEEEAKETDFRL